MKEHFEQRYKSKIKNFLDKFAMEIISYSRFLRIFFFWAVFPIIGCTSLFKNSSQERYKEKLLKCYSDYLDTVKVTPEYSQVRLSFEDTMKGWIDKKLDYVWNNKFEDFYIDSAIFFDRDKKRCLLFYIDTKYDTVGKNLDNAQIIGGEKINEKWVFYIKSFPSLGYHRIDHKPYTIKYLSDETRYSIVSDGYILFDSCKINYDYIDSDLWFADWKIQMHHEYLLTGSNRR